MTEPRPRPREPEFWFLEVTGSPSWMKQAECARKVGGQPIYDPEMWWPMPGHHGAQYHRAIAICETCPVMLQCRAWAVDNHVRDGVWGGMVNSARVQWHRQGRRTFTLELAG